MFKGGEVGINLGFDLRFGFGAESVDRHHVLDQADADASGDAADIVLLQDRADGGVLLDGFIDGGFADVPWKIHGFAPFVLLLSTD